MSSERHTPGPWKAAESKMSRDGNLWFIAGPVGFIGSQFRRAIAETYDQANAVLIAAAPALLKTLKALAASEVYVDNGHCSICGGYWPKEHRDDCVGLEALTAIAKAEGR